MKLNTSVNSSKSAFMVIYMNLDDVSYLRVPRAVAQKLDRIAKRKDRIKAWSAEAREILEKAVEAEETSH
jgi:predicted DNA-binding protein